MIRRRMSGTLGGDRSFKGLLIMSGVLTHLTALIALCVLGVLIAGIWNLGRKGSNPNLSQKLMRWRVGLQFVAILVAMLALAVMRH